MLLGGTGRMKTLVAANQKGGVGKTSMLVHLAFDFLERGLRVVVVDLDTQANASYTLQAHQSGLVASALFAEESCSFSQQDLLDSLQLWLDKAGQHIDAG